MSSAAPLATLRRRQARGPQGPCRAAVASHPEGYLPGRTFERVEVLHPSANRGQEGPLDQLLVGREIGGGGLGDLAIRYGYYRYQTEVIIFIVAILVLLVILIQSIGNRLARKLDKR